MESEEDAESGEDTEETDDDMLPETFQHLKHKCTEAKRENIVKSADNSDIRKIVEICLNALHGNVPLTKARKRELQRQRKSIIKLAKCGRNDTRARRVIVREGGFLPLLLSSLKAPLLHAIF
jgi:ribosome maturation protein Sdo1